MPDKEKKKKISCMDQLTNGDRFGEYTIDCKNRKDYTLLGGGKTIRDGRGSKSNNC